MRVERKQPFGDSAQIAFEEFYNVFIFGENSSLNLSAMRFFITRSSRIVNLQLQVNDIPETKERKIQCRKKQSNLEFIHTKWIF